MAIALTTLTIAAKLPSPWSGLHKMLRICQRTVLEPGGETDRLCNPVCSCCTCSWVSLLIRRSLAVALQRHATHAKVQTKQMPTKTHKIIVTQSGHGKPSTVAAPSNANWLIMMLWSDCEKSPTTRDDPSTKLML